MMAFSSWSMPPIDTNTAVLLHVFLPFVVGFLASRLIYGWVRKAGVQSAGFSPTVATILTTPLLACAYYALLTGFLPGYFGMKVALNKMGFVLVLFGPIILPITPLLTIYLRGGFRRKKMFGVVLCAAAVAFVILEFLGLYLLSSRLE
jgi:hypothetical protein